MFFFGKYRTYRNSYKQIQQDIATDTAHKINQLRIISWAVFNLKMTINAYLEMLHGKRLSHRMYIHHVIFQFDEFLTPMVRQKHHASLWQHEHMMKQLLFSIYRDIYSCLNENIYSVYN